MDGGVTWRLLLAISTSQVLIPSSRIACSRRCVTVDLMYVHVDLYVELYYTQL